MTVTDYAGDRQEVTCVIKKQRSIDHSFGYVPSFVVSEFVLFAVSRTQMHESWKRTAINGH